MAKEENEELKQKHEAKTKEYDEIIKKEVEIWKPPYDSSKEELLDMIRE